MPIIKRELKDYQVTPDDENEDIANSVKGVWHTVLLVVFTLLVVLGVIGWLIFW